MEDTDIKSKIVIAGLLVVAVFAMLFGMVGLYNEPASAVPTAVTPTPGATPSATATGAPTTAPGATATIPGATPTMKKEWKGNSSQTTETFTVTSAPWAVSWSNNPTMVGGQSIGSLVILLIDSKNPATPIPVTNSTKVEANSSNFQQTGTFSLQIIASNTQWIVQLWTK